jgi:hypothetical protein
MKFSLIGFYIPYACPSRNPSNDGGFLLRRGAVRIGSGGNGGK